MSWKTTRHDKFYHLAKEQGYRSRACFKLIQLNRKYNFLGKCKAVLDLCAAPGGWLQVCHKYMPQGSTIIGVDILPIRALPGVITIMGDIMKQSTANEIQEHLQNWKVDAVLHDGAPNIGGSSWAKDAYGQNELTIHALRLATKYLKPDGWFVTKVFRSQDYPAVLEALKPFFRKIEATKPSSSRNASPEIFVVCQGYLAPKRIDPNSLEPTVLFARGGYKGAAEDQDAGDHQDEETPMILDKQPMTISANQFMKVTNLKRKRNRAGYEDDAGVLLFKSGKVEDFVKHREPIGFLMQFNQLEFEPNSPLLEQPATTDEIKELFADLKVLSRGGFAALLKWRKKILKATHPEQSAIGADGKRARGEGGEQGEDGEEDPETAALTPEEKIAKQIGELQSRLAKERLKYKRQKHQLRQKMRKRLEMNPHLAGESLMDTPADAGLFSLSDALQRHQGHPKELLDALNNPDSLNPEDMVDSEDELVEAAVRRQQEENPIAGKYGVAMDPDEYMRVMEQQLDDLHSLYQEHRKKVKERQEKLGLDLDGKKKQRAGKKQKQASAEGSDDDDDLEISLSERESDEDEEMQAADEADSESEEEEEGQGGKDKRELTEQDAVRVNRWFSRDLFASAEQSLLNQSIPKQQAKADAAAKQQADKQSRKQRQRREAASDVEMAEDLTSDEEEEVSVRELSPTEARNLERTQQAPQKPSRRQLKALKAEQEPDELGLPNPKKQRKLDGGSAAPPVANSKNKRDALRKAAKAGKDAPEGEKSDKGVLEIVPQKNPEAVVSLFDRHGRGGEEDPEAGAAGSDSDSDLTDYSSDTDAEAEVMAMAESMLRKKSRNDILDNGYNRYTYNDPPGLPSWFVDEEEQFNKPLLPITKEQVDKFKEELRAINARPSKKIAEAKARNKQRTLKRWEKLKTQSEGIAAQSDLTDEEKLRSIAKLYQRTPKKSIKRDKVYLVSRKNGAAVPTAGAKKGAKAVRVDRRMRADRRGEKMSARRQKASVKATNKRKVSKKNQ